ncbi:MAG: transporter substrate-binding domain-containing protein [Beijerinckiaceae bacterium]|jgi:membrane-bound lytic murein transglycosylase MltF|nr:transporter substrate-binding domain-containing protein [Beijerinckiaceae bacterium]
MPRILIALCVALLAGLAGAAATHAQTPQSARLRTDLRIATGDLDAILKRRVVRLIVPFSRTLFFIDRGRQYGLVAEFGSEFETWLNARHKGGAGRVSVVFIPTPRNRMLDALKKGEGDIIAANLTITPERLAEVDFARPWLTDVREIVVTGPAAPPLATLEDLSGQSVQLRVSSSYASHIRALSAKLELAGRKPIRIEPTPTALEDEDLLEMVQAGLLPLAIVDEHKVRPWLAIFPALRAREDLTVNAGGEIAWAIRNGSPALKAEVDAFFEETKIGTSFRNTVFQRYFGGRNAVKPATSSTELQKFNGHLDSFQRHGETNGFDYLMLAAQGYQESQLEQKRRSHRGAIGVMQLLPRTAAAPPVSIRDIASDADTNIRAGALYMQHLRETYLRDPALDPHERMLMTLAAYNAGPGNLRKFRRLAREKGLDPDRWFGNVEHAAAMVVGRETVQYVSNIYKYYLTYRLVVERENASLAARGTFRRLPPAPGL